MAQNEGRKEIDGKREVVGIVLFFLAVSLMLIFYLPETVTGSLGDVIKSLGLGLVGTTAYIVPVLILYAAIDYFFEKRKGVARIRVRSVILLLVCISALLAFTMDIDYVRSVSVNAEGKATATAAIELLWKSGGNASLISSPSSTDTVIPGGVLGGSVAIAFSVLTGKTIGILAIIAFFISQVILVFHISLKKTAQAVNQVRKTATRNVRRNLQRNTQPKPRQYYDPNFNRKPADNSRFVNPKIKPQVKDPFNTGIPVDVNSGFIDVSGKEFGADTVPHPDVLNYEERSESIPGDNYTADFSYTAMPKNPPYHERGKMKVPSFLQKEKQQDFIDLEGGSRPAAPVETEFEDDYPVEIESANEMVEDFIYDKPRIRKPNIELDEEGNIENIDNIVEEPYVPEEAEETMEADDTAVSFKDEPVAEKPAPRRPKPRTNMPKARELTSLLAKDEYSKKDPDLKAKLDERARKLEEALKSFGIEATVINITHGPSITRFEMTLKVGTKVSKVLSLQDDIALAMAAMSVRIEAPIPGKSAIGIEIPNKTTTPVHIKSLLENKEFQSSTPLTVALGRDIPGRPILCDLAKMPHLLIAGSTGSGKSVCINTILTSILCKASPDQVRLIMIDPKVVELSIYNGIPHLYMPVVTDPKKAANALRWAVDEMNRRYRLFAENSVRDINGYNEFLKLEGEKPLPLVLIVIDELADLMTVASKDVEEQISRLAAMARAAGLHMIIATQRPSTDVITGVIKSNVPSRIAFAVSSSIDSRVILDSNGAEKLLGKGDMLYAPLSAPKPIRGQGAFVSDKEVESIVSKLKEYGSDYDEEIIKIVESGTTQNEADAASGSGEDGDDLLDQAVEVVIEYGSASVSILQRRLGVGYPRAARLIDVLERKKFIGPYEGSKPRKVLITQTDWLEIKAKGGN